MGKQFTLYSAETYSEPYQESFSKNEAFSVVNYFKSLDVWQGFELVSVH